MVSILGNKHRVIKTEEEQMDREIKCNRAQISQEKFHQRIKWELFIFVAVPSYCEELYASLPLLLAFNPKTVFLFPLPKLYFLDA